MACRPSGRMDAFILDGRRGIGSSILGRRRQSLWLWRQTTQLSYDYGVDVNCSNRSLVYRLPWEQTGDRALKRDSHALGLEDG